MRIVPIKDQSQMTVDVWVFYFCPLCPGEYFDIPISLSYVLCLVQICKSYHAKLRW